MCQVLVSNFQFSWTIPLGSNVKVFLVENGSTPLNYAEVTIQVGEEGLFSIQEAAKSELGIKGEFKIYDQNGCEIADNDFQHLENNDWICICPKKRDFNYKSLLDMFVKIKKLGQGGFGSVHLIKNIFNNKLIAAKFVDVTEFMNKADNIQLALKEARYLINLDHQNIINLESVFLIK